MSNSQSNNTVAVKNLPPVSLRICEDEERYIAAKKAGKTKSLISEPRLKEWRYWALIDNAFPYNIAFQTHHMLIPKREVAVADLTLEEKEELESVLDELSNQYDCQLINFPKKQSILNHYHIHLLVYKDNRQDIEI